MNDIQISAVCAFQDNYIWVIRRANLAAVVDPGDARPVLDYLHAEKLELRAILNTHHHPDHVGGNAELLQHYAVPVYGPYDERIVNVSHRLRDGDSFELAPFGVRFSVFEIPGHTRTHIAFYGADMLFCGDTLFACGCGRLFEGTPRQMHDSLTKLASLPAATRVYCGHEYTLANIRFAKAVEPSNRELELWQHSAQQQRAKNEPTLPSTIGRERAANPFLRCDTPEIVASAHEHAGKSLANTVEVLAVIRDWKNNF